MTDCSRTIRVHPQADLESPFEISTQPVGWSELFGVLFVNATDGTEMSGLDGLLSDFFPHLQITLKRGRFSLTGNP